MIDSSLLPVGPMARRLRVPVAWLKDEAKAGRVPHLRAGAQFLFDAALVEKLLLDRARQQKGGPRHVAK